MNVKRFIALCSFAILLGLSLVAAQDEQDGKDPDKPAVPDEFVMSILPSRIEYNPIHTFTSSEAQLYTAIYEGLVTYNPLTMDPVPAVAQRWEVTPDGKTYRFYLRENARYWNGDPVTAADFRNAWLKLLDPAEKSEYSFLFDIIAGAEDYRTGKNPDPGSVGIKVLSEKVLEVQLAKPATHFLQILCHHSFVPIHPEMQNVSDWNSLPSILGNGPYYIISKSDSEIVLRKNELYWDRKNVSINRIRVIMSDDYAGTTAQFNVGKIDWVASGMSLQDVKDPANLVINPLFATTYYFISSREKPWTNPDVRRALALLLPWDEIRSPDIQFIPADTLVPQIPYYPEVKGITEKNSEEALKLLAKAGFPGGKGLPEITVKVPDGDESARVAGIMKKAWEALDGVTVNVKSVDYGNYFESLKDADYLVGTVSWIADFADPLTFLQMWTSGSNLNDSGYANPEYDALIASSFEQTGVPRYETLAKAEEMLLSTGVVLPVSHSPAINLIDVRRFDGWYPNPLDIHPFKFLKFAVHKPLPNLASRSGTQPVASR